MSYCFGVGVNVHLDNFIVKILLCRYFTVDIICVKHFMFCCCLLLVNKTKVVLLKSSAFITVAFPAEVSYVSWG